MDIDFNGEMVDDAYKLGAGGEFVHISNTNIPSSTPFIFSGTLLASNNNCYPHFGDGYASGKFNIFFDFQEGFSQLCVDGEPVCEWLFSDHAGLDWYSDTSFNNFHTWSLTYDGTTTWVLNINGIDLPYSNIFSHGVFSGINYDLTFSNYPTFGEGYVLLKSFAVNI